MQIVVVEDNERFVEGLTNTLEEFFGLEEEAVKVRHMEGTGLLEELEKGPCCDLCLLDVEMPGMDGITLGKKIRERNEEVRIVYLTAHEKYAFSSYDVRAYGYIKKGDYQEELPRLLNRILKEERDKQTDCYISRTENQGYKIMMSDILYVEKDRKYVSLHCRREKEYRDRETLESIMQKLPQDRFVFIDKGVIVNLEHVVEYVDKDLILRDGTRLQVSRRAWPRVRAVLEEYWR